MATPQDVLAFWLDEVGPEGWYKQDEALDSLIRDRFLDTWEEARVGALGLWLTCPSETLAYIMVTDQFPRNMFRGDPRSFATDQPARAAAKMAVSKNWDVKIDEPARQFFYLPMMHSENLSDQDQAVRLFHTRMPESGADNMDHARAHRQIIRDFGRFPYRNAALSRENSPQERAFLEGPGYKAVLKDIQQETAAAD